MDVEINMWMCIIDTELIFILENKLVLDDCIKKLWVVVPRHTLKTGMIVLSYLWRSLKTSRVVGYKMFHIARTSSGPLSHLVPPIIQIHSYKIFWVRRSFLPGYAYCWFSPRRIMTGISWQLHRLFWLTSKTIVCLYLSAAAIYGSIFPEK